LASGTTAQGGTSTPIQFRPPEFQFLILLDPGHGGTDNGATLGTAGEEKTYTLALAMRLRALLNADRIHSILTRDADVTLDGAARAEIANRAHAAACILLHTTSTGTGVHLFTSSLPANEQPDPKRAFLRWQTAQAAYITQSLRLESDIDAALARQQVPVLLDRTSFMPLDSMACPAVAVEVAPLNANTPLTDAAYQQKILNSLSAALIAWHGDWRLQP
jgi:N-acetylmuramoyl-L-alanine amidase